LKERIVNMRVAMRLLGGGMGKSPDDLSEAREDIEDIRQCMRGLTGQHVPESVRLVAQSYTSSMETLEEIVQDADRHRHNMRSYELTRRSERERERDIEVDFDD